MFRKINNESLKQLITSKNNISNLSNEEQTRIKNARIFYNRFAKRYEKATTEFQQFMKKVRTNSYLEFMCNDIRKPYTNAYDK